MSESENKIKDFKDKEKQNNDKDIADKTAVTKLIEKNILGNLMNKFNIKIKNKKIKKQNNLIICSRVRYRHCGFHCIRNNKILCKLDKGFCNFQQLNKNENEND